MKKLLFLGIVVLMVQSLGAVTLPSTSYSPYVGSTPSTDESFITDGGTMVTGSYSVLRDASACIGAADCETCCYNELHLEECDDQCETLECQTQCYIEKGNVQCINDCEQGGSLPLDGGLSILLLLSLAGGAIKLIRVKGQNNRNKII